VANVPGPLRRPGFDGFVVAITDLSVDYAQLAPIQTPVEAWSAERTGYVPNTAASLTAIPGLTVTFYLSGPALVQLQANGEMRETTTTNYCHVGLGYRVDGVKRGNATY